jgi:hypothetical protein
MFALLQVILVKTRLRKRDVAGMNNFFHGVAFAATR